jgi:hypothetical protein
VITPEGERLLAGAGVAAAAVVDEASGEPIGFVRIDALEPALIGPDLAAAMQVIARSLLPAVTLIDQQVRQASISGSATPPRPGLTAGLRRGWRQLRAFKGAPETTETAAETEKTLAS